MTNEQQCGSRKREALLKAGMKAVISAGLILCVDLGFAACSGETDTLELVEVSDDAETADPESGSDTEASPAEDAASEEDAVISNAAQEEDAAEEEDAAADGTDAQENVIVVYVCGAVVSPGVYELPEGTRVYEAVEAAGGFAENAEETYVNQALILSDQDRLYIPTKDEASEEGTESTAYGVTNGTGTAASGDASSKDVESGSALINLNTATQEELESLPGIGEARALAIIAYREEHGAFSSIEDIQNVSGIGEAIYANLKAYITVD